jgi:hypothetical protein
MQKGALSRVRTLHLQGWGLRAEGWGLRFKKKSSDEEREQNQGKSQESWKTRIKWRESQYIDKKDDTVEIKAVSADSNDSQKPQTGRKYS